jgi:hypothetical protein
MQGFFKRKPVTSISINATENKKDSQPGLSSKTSTPMQSFGGTTPQKGKQQELISVFQDRLLQSLDIEGLVSPPILDEKMVEEVVELGAPGNGGCKEYFPAIFAAMRQLCGITPLSFWNSLAGEFKTLSTNSKGGQFFLLSHDGRYLLKTLSETESRRFQKITLALYKHWQRYPSSLLNRLLGHYCVHSGKNRAFLMVMDSVFFTPLLLKKRFDLKGSTVGRSSAPGDSVLKDNDFRKANERLVLATPGAREVLLEAVIALLYTHMQNIKNSKFTLKTQKKNLHNPIYR